MSSAWRRVLFYLKRSSAALALPYFSPCTEFLILPYFEYAIQAAHPGQSRDAKALEKVQKLSLKFMKGRRHVPYKVAFKQLRLFSLTHRRIRGDLIPIFKITHNLLEFSMESIFTHPIRKGLRDHHVPPTEMLYAPSKVRLHHSGCPILEETAG